MTPAPEGLLLVDKPAGMTSHDVVDVVRRTLGTRKVGHAGTLDPMATGLLVLGVGRATRLLRYLGELPKTYAATGRLGEETDTLDADGELVRTAPVEVSLAEAERACAALVGDSMQTPPAYSAVKVGGRKLYEAARKGDVLEAPARPIRVDAFEVTGVRRPRSRGPDHLLRRNLRAGPGGRRRPGARVRRPPGSPAPHRDRVVPGRGRSSAGRGHAGAHRAGGRAPAEHRRRDRGGAQRSRTDGSWVRRASRVRTPCSARTVR